MFSPIANSTYIQNNFFGNRSYQTPSMGGNNFYNGSLFGFGFGGCAPSFPSFGCMPSFGYQSFNFMPSFPMMGGCCNSFGGGFGMFDFSPMYKMFDMFSLLNTFNTTVNLTNRTVNTFSSLTSRNRVSNASRSQAQTVRNAKINTSTNLDTLKDVGYNPEKGAALAKDLANNAKGFTGYCAKSVRESLDRTGLGTGERGNGCEYADILSKNPNFKEISTANINLSSLPAGCLLVYDRGVSGYSREAGHVEGTLGNGQAVSDGVTNNIRNGARVFVPV